MFDELLAAELPGGGGGDGGGGDGGGGEPRAKTPRVGGGASVHGARAEGTFAAATTPAAAPIDGVVPPAAARGAPAAPGAAAPAGAGEGASGDVARRELDADDARLRALAEEVLVGAAATPHPTSSSERRRRLRLVSAVVTAAAAAPGDLLCSDSHASAHPVRARRLEIIAGAVGGGVRADDVRQQIVEVARGCRAHGIARGTDAHAELDRATLAAREAAHGRGWVTESSPTSRAVAMFDVAALLLRGPGVDAALRAAPASPAHQPLTEKPQVHLAREATSRWRLIRPRSATEGAYRARQYDNFRKWLHGDPAFLKGKAPPDLAVKELHAVLRAALAIAPSRERDLALAGAYDDVVRIARAYDLCEPPRRLASSEDGPSPGGPPPTSTYSAMLAQSPFGRAALAQVRVAGGDGRQPLGVDDLLCCPTTALESDFRARVASGGYDTQ